MRVTVVPAQVTTVEDRIVGDLGLSQLLLLTTPVFGSSALYAILPPSFHNATYKLVIVGVLILLCSAMAMRIKGTILLLWLVMLLRYNLRPRYYVFDKRSMSGRKHFEVIEEVQQSRIAAKRPRQHKPLPLSIAEIIRLEHIVKDPAANLSFETRKGGLYVCITEVKQEN